MPIETEKLSSDQLADRLKQVSTSLIMGVLNITPDSFSDGGMINSPNQALQHARRLLEEGADILDIGGESTRPDADKLSLEEELNRTIPVIELLSKELNVPLSVDSSKPEVMRAAVSAGAVMINDVNALRSPDAMQAAVDTNAVICLMHMQGSPRTMQTRPQYDDVVPDIIAFLRDRSNDAVISGVATRKILLDPGFGFGKTMRQNFRILQQLTRFKSLGFPLLVGLSRKSMIGDLLDIPVDERMPASVVLAALAAERGARVIRVHDVAETRQAVRLVAQVND